jgi:LacI family transcriptional regulator, galactose operon repressor
MSRRKRSVQAGEHKMPSIYDVAKEAHVSVFTVSAVVNKKSHVGTRFRQRVEAAIKKLNYRPNLLARSFAKRQTHTIGLVVPDICNPFFPQLIRGAEDAAHKHGYNILLSNSDDRIEKEHSSLELLLSKRVDGILLTKTPGPFSPSLRQMVDDFQVPFVLLMRTFPSISKDAVITDDYKGAFEAASQLARVGHRKIAMVGGPLKVSNGRARWKGFKDALKAHGLTYYPELVFEGDYRIESGYHAGHTMLARKPDGVYVANYLMTVGFLKAAEEMGMHCPENFGLVSFDDYPWLDIFRPALTTVELPKYQVGYEAAELLMERIAGKRTPGVLIKLPPQLRVRESCGFASQMRRSVAGNATNS